MTLDDRFIVEMAVNAQKFKALRARLKLAEKSFRLQFNKEIRQAVEPLSEKVRESALSSLPRSGGLAAGVAGSKFKVSVTASTVKFKMDNPYTIGAMNKGKLRHPVYGNRSAWVFQQVEPGFWQRPVEEMIPEIRQKVDEVMLKVAKEIEGL